MATAVQISLAEYLSTTYRPDREYIDGEAVEKNLGKWEHGRTQIILGMMLAMLEESSGLIGATEWRFQTRPDRVRLPDITLVDSGPQAEILRKAPALTVEILSPGDSYASARRKSQEYIDMGTRALWIIDPVRRTAEAWDGRQWQGVTVLEIAGTPISIALDDLFARVGPTPAWA